MEATERLGKGRKRLTNTFDLFMGFELYPIYKAGRNFIGWFQTSESLPISTIISVIQVGLLLLGGKKNSQS